MPQYRALALFLATLISPFAHAASISGTPFEQTDIHAIDASRQFTATRISASPHAGNPSVVDAVAASVDHPEPMDAAEMAGVYLLTPDSWDAAFSLRPSDDPDIHIDERGRRWQYLHELDDDAMADIDVDNNVPIEAIADPVERLAHELRPYMAAQGKLFILAQPDHALARRIIDAGDRAFVVPGSDYLERQTSLSTPLVTAKTVLGSDGRSHKPDVTGIPLKAQVYLKSRPSWTSPGDYTCSGMMVGSRTILTAAHCLSRYGDNLKLNPEIKLYPGAKKGFTPYGVFQSAKEGDICSVYWPAGFNSALVDGNPYVPSSGRKNDLAVIRLCKNPGVNWHYGFGNLTAFYKTLYLWGYPGSGIPTWLQDIFPQIFGMECAGREMYASMFHHVCDSTGGQSGSGLYRNTSQYGRIIVGIDTTTVSHIRNGAVRMNNAHTQFVLEYGF